MAGGIFVIKSFENGILTAYNMAANMAKEMDK